jgi:hypothetical protein
MKGATKDELKALWKSGFESQGEREMRCGAAYLFGSAMD